MNEKDLIATQTIKQISEGGDAVRADLKATASAQDQLAASAGNLATVTETSARRQTSAAAAFDALVRRADPAARALAELEKNFGIANRALAQNPTLVDQAGKALDVYRQRLVAAEAAQKLFFGSTSAKVIDTNLNVGTSSSGSAMASADAFMQQFGGLEGIAKAKAAQIGRQFGISLDEAMIAGTAKSATDSAAVFSEELGKMEEIGRQKAYAAASVQDRINKMLGIGVVGPTSSAKASASAFFSEADIKANDHMTDSINNLRSSMRPLEVEQGKLGAQMAQYRTWVKEGNMTTEEFAEAQTMAGKRLGDFSQNLRTAGTAGRVMSGELVNMSYQLNDVVTGLALGQSPFMIMAQQGGQVVQILQNSKAGIGEFAGAAISSFGKMFTATRVLVGGVAGLGAGVLIAAAEWQSAQKDIERSLIGIGARTGTTVADVNKFASANASATGLSVDQARSSAIEFTKTGMIAVGQLKGLGDAVHGYSILTGKNATDATKDLAQALSGDLVKGAQQLNQTYGFLNPAMEDNIRKLVNQGDRAKAQQVIINAMAADNKKAEETVGSLAKAWDAVWNAASRAKNAAGEFLSGGSETPEQELERLVKRQETLTRRGITGGSTQERITELQGNQGDAFSKESARIQTAGKSAVESVLPGIKQVQDLEAELGKLQQAKKDASDVGIKILDTGAEMIIRNVITATMQATGEAIRYNERVADISQKWGNVGQATALALQNMQNQLPVAQAWTESGRIRAQYQATYNDLLDKGKTTQEATALASKQEELSKAAAVANAQKLVQSSQDNVDQIRAQGTGMEGVVAASIAYRDAMQAGATSTQAAAISANTLQASLLQAAKAAQQTEMQQSFKSQGLDSNGVATMESLNAYAASAKASSQLANGQQHTYSADPNNPIFYRDGGGGMRLSINGMNNNSVRQFAAMQPNNLTDIANRALPTGGIDSAINQVQSTGNRAATKDQYFGGNLLSAAMPAITDAFSTVASLYDLKNSTTNDNATKVSNLQQEMAWLQTQPQTLERNQAIINLQQSIDALKNATDANTAATQATLNPLYSQGHGALAIGYYKAATGLEGVVGGSGGTDSTPVHMMLTPGENLKVTPAGSNDNSRQTTIVQNFYGSSNDNSRRSQRQARQGFAQSMAAIG